jgi:hypothetical protein
MPSIDQPTKSPRVASRTFILVELLVVIGISAILAAMRMPPRPARPTQMSGWILRGFAAIILDEKSDVAAAPGESYKRPIAFFEKRITF